MSTREEIVKQNLEFVYGKRTHDKLDDPDKVSYRPAKPKYVDPDAISRFDGDYAFLAPSFPCHVYIPAESEPYPSFEHALLASKFKTIEKRIEVRAIPDIRDVKRLISKERNKTSVIDVNWNDRCLQIAEVLLIDKFIRNKSLRDQLMRTGRKSLIFLNYFGDTFWGIDDQQKGQNNLGKLMEKVRFYIDQGDDLDIWIKNQVSLLEADKICVHLQVIKDDAIVPEDCKSFELCNKLIIGKAVETCDIVAAHPTISRAHAILIVRKNEGCPLAIVDLGSANGTKLNGQILLPYTVTPLLQHQDDRSVLLFGASGRQYIFTVDTAADIKRRTKLLQKIATEPVRLSDGRELAENTVFVGNIAFSATRNNVEVNICCFLIFIIFSQCK